MADHPIDYEFMTRQLQQTNRELNSEIETLVSACMARQRYIEQLEKELAALKQELFGLKQELEDWKSNSLT